MKLIDTIYIKGQFVTPHGTEMADLVAPTAESNLTRLWAPMPAHEI